MRSERSASVAMQPPLYNGLCSFSVDEPSGASCTPGNKKFNLLKLLELDEMKFAETEADLLQLREKIRLSLPTDNYDEGETINPGDTERKACSKKRSAADVHEVAYTAKKRKS